MKNFLLVLCLISTACVGQIKLSPQATISVITCGPGQEEVFTAFGHSAFRVHDPVTGIDDAYNYGVFDFDQPHFYLNFARGHNNYKLGVHNYKQFEYVYIYYKRYLHAQVLNLTPAQTQRLFDFLQWNARPENQYYRYDYFYDNCATKIPEVVSKVFGDSVKFDGSYITTNYTIRELTDLYLKWQPWGDLGIDIGLGLPMDKKATPYEYMFLPDYVESGFAHATIRHGNQTVPLVRSTEKVFEPSDEHFRNGMFQPLYVFSLLFVMAALISYRDLRRKKITMVFDTILFTVLGVLGLLLTLLWFATDHHAAARNMNLLWALPTHLVAVIAFIKQPKWLEKYFLGVAVLSIVLLLTWPLLPQKLHYALIPIEMTIALRSFVQYRIRNVGRKNYPAA
jgi:hypothetical protein